jgi:hypothetical protein
MKTHRGSKSVAILFHTLSSSSVLDGGGWATLRLGHFTPGNETQLPTVQSSVLVPGPDWTGVENLTPPHRNSILGPSSPYQIAILSMLSRPTIQANSSNKE